MGITKVLPIVFSIILLGSIGYLQDAEAGAQDCSAVSPLFNPSPLQGIGKTSIDGSGVIVSYSVSAIDCNGNSASVSCLPASGTLFPIGRTTVTCTATNMDGGTATQTFPVIIIGDTAPPVITLNSVSIGSQEAPVVFDLEQFIIDNGHLTDNIDPNPIIVSSDEPAEYVNRTPVTFTVQDASGNSADYVVSFNFTPSGADGDGIANSVDPDPNNFSDQIDDSDGTTGQIISYGDQRLQIFDNPNPGGVFFNSDVLGGGPNPATLQACDNAAELVIDGGDAGIFTCGSVTVGILAGTVETSFTTGGPPVTSSMSPPDELTYDPGTLTITNTGFSTATITFLGEDIDLLPGDSITIVIPSGGKGSTTAQDPNLGDVRHGQGHPNGFCMNQNCMNVDGFFNHFPETTVRQGSTQSFTVLVNCPRGASTCNHISLGGGLPDSDFYDDQWTVTVDKQPRSDNWDLTVYNPFGEIDGDAASVTVQPVGNSFVTATFNIPFLIPGSIGTFDGVGVPQENNRHLHVTVWDNNGGMSNYIFNEGIFVDDIYAYPQVETSFDEPLEYDQICVNENINKRYSCTFDKVREWTIKNAEEKLKEL